MNAAPDTVAPIEERPLDDHARALQAHLLERVSRTFALTIPRLPAALVDIVGNAYLLCRIVDTVEDELPVDDAAKAALYARFLHALESIPASRHDSGGGPRPGTAFSEDVERLLPISAPQGEIELARLIPDVLQVTAGFSSEQQAVLRDCIRTMTDGMQHFERLGANGLGLRDGATLDAYCYHVAGCVGELLTELFCLHDPAVAARRETLAALSVRFGHGLQLTNILKDMWLDHARGVCWLPRDAFDLAAYTGRGAANRPAVITLPELMQRALEGDVLAQRLMDRGTRRLIARCRGHLDEAMTYVRTLPVQQLGMRVFCLWSIGLAVLTLRRIRWLSIEQRRHGTKVTRPSVRATLLFSDASARHSRVMMFLYRSACVGLPRR